MHRSRLSIVLASSIVASSFAIAGGCSSDDNGGSGAGPDAGDASSAVDGGKRDTGGLPSGDGGGPDGVAPVDAGGDTAAPVDAGPPPPPAGMQLATGAGLALFAVTSDGYAIYADGAGVVWAESVAGGAPIQIATGFTPLGVIGAIGKVVFVWPAPSSATLPLSELDVWSKATSAVKVTSVSYAGVASASADGSKILYSANVDLKATVGDIVAANADNTGAATVVSQTLLPGTQANPTKCSASLGFAGPQGNDALVAYCPPVDAGTPSATLSAFTGAGWTKRDLATDLVPLSPSTFTLDRSGDALLVVTNGGAIDSIAYPSGTVTQLDTGAQYPGFYVKNGANAVYTTAAGALKESPTAAPVPVSLVATGVKGVYVAPSPDENWCIYATKSDAQGTTDVNLSSTLLPNTSKVVYPNTGTAFYGPQFTADSSILLYYDAVTDITSNAAVGTLNAFPVAGSTSKVVATAVWQHWTTTGAKVVYDDDAVAAANAVHADIKVVDLSVSTPAPKLLQGSADANIFMTPDLSKVVYTYNVGTAAQNGLYVIAAQ